MNVMTNSFDDIEEKYSVCITVVVNDFYPNYGMLSILDLITSTIYSTKIPIVDTNYRPFSNEEIRAIIINKINTERAKHNGTKA